MTRRISWLLAALFIGLLCSSSKAPGRGFGGGGFRGGGGFGGDRSFGGGDFGGDRFGGGNFGGDRSYGGGDFGGDRFGGAYGGDRVDGEGADRYGGLSSDRYSGDYGADRLGGYGGDRYSSWGGANSLDRNWAGSAVRSTPVAKAATDTNWQSAFAGTRFPTDFGLSHYSAFNAAGVNHVTATWSQGTIANRAGDIRSNFGYYNCFHPDWYAAHPGCWFAAGWAADAAWNAATWSTVATWCAISAQPAYYDYGNNIVYQNNDVYYDAQDVCTAQQYAESATTLADQGQQANPPATDEWEPLGVFSLVQGNETTSNDVFQLALNKQGIIRGNYYDGLMNTTTPVFGSVDKKNQRVAWTIGKSNDRVFDTGICNLTKSESPVLVHFGATRTQQWLLVRVKQPQSAQPQN